MAGALDEKVHALALLDEAGAEDNEVIVRLAARSQRRHKPRILAPALALVLFPCGQVAASLRQYGEGPARELRELDMGALARQRRREHGLVGPKQRAPELVPRSRVDRELVHQADGYDTVPGQRLQNHPRFDAVDDREFRTVQFHQQVYDHRGTQGRVTKLHRPDQPRATAAEVLSERAIAQQHGNHVVAPSKRGHQVEAQHRRTGPRRFVRQHEHRFPSGIERDTALRNHQARAQGMPAFGPSVGQVMLIRVDTGARDVGILQQVKAGVEGLFEYGRRIQRRFRRKMLIRADTGDGSVRALQVEVGVEDLLRQGQRILLRLSGKPRALRCLSRSRKRPFRRARQPSFDPAASQVVVIGPDVGHGHVRILREVPLRVERIVRPRR